MFEKYRFYTYVWKFSESLDFSQNFQKNHNNSENFRKVSISVIIYEKLWLYE